MCIYIYIYIHIGAPRKNDSTYSLRRQPLKAWLWEMSIHISSKRYTQCSTALCKVMRCDAMRCDAMKTRI